MASGNLCFPPEILCDVLEKRKRSLRGSGAPAIRVANRREGIAMKRRRSMHAERFEVIGRGVAFVPGKAVLRVHRVPLFHAHIAMSLGEDGGGSDGNAARVALD